MAEEKNLYDEKFYRAQKDGSHRSATVVLPVLKKFIRPQTVVDVGCGVGTWLKVWQDMGAKVFGLDGDYVDRLQLLIDEKTFRPTNLEERINLDKKFDLAMTLEVAEHLSPSRAESFVEDLTKLADVILFSAAIPGQGGTNHINEQFPSNWSEKFLKHDYICIDCLRSQIWNNDQIEFWYRQNIFVYAKSSELYRYPELEKFYLEHRDNQIIDSVHPQMWFNALMAIQNLYNQLQKNIHGGGGVGIFSTITKNFFYLLCGDFFLRKIFTKKIPNHASGKIFLIIFFVRNNQIKYICNIICN